MSFLNDAKSSLGDAQSSLGDAKSWLGDVKSSLGDARSSLGDAESSLGERSERVLAWLLRWARLVDPDSATLAHTSDRERLRLKELGRYAGLMQVRFR